MANNYRRSPSGGGGWSAALSTANSLAQNYDDNKSRQQNEYMKALSKQREHELRQQKQEFEIARELVNQISKKFPLGDQKSDTNFEMFKQTQEYKELSKVIKKGLPGSVVDGQVMRLPAYDVMKNKMEYEKSALEERVTSGTASQEDKLRFAQLKEGSKLYDAAMRIAATTEGYDKLNPMEQTDLIQQNFTTLIRSKVDSLSNKGMIPMEQQEQPAPQAPGFFANFMGGNKNTAALAQAPQLPGQEPVQQGVTPSPATKQKVPNYTILK